ncbi:DUF4190 domain-containing protein [Mycobacterium yunnanensis]|uniref:DUF4190 domain-containing protein n=1 Tax=Mycobacterium yunnanensis TaxID=368477 RepID=A0A9X2YNR2_9MYCO|nr:DUF4190 domain-containing protein [Mycobacterium yunnanensis]MCV7422772.1 DUF4190 domain-containing protein [Mycobacterium yunnanensis]
MTGPRNGTGTAALAVAVAGLALCWSVLGGLVCGVVALILGGVGRARATRREADNGPVAAAGMALGTVAVVASVAFAVIWGLAWRDSGGAAYVDCAVKAGDDRAAAQACTDEWVNGLQEKFGVSPRPTRGST